MAYELIYTLINDGTEYELTRVEGEPDIGGSAELTAADLNNKRPDKNKPLTSIGHRAFSWCKGLTKVELPDTVKTIREYAFSACFGLKELIIPEGVESIRDWAFYGCEELSNINLPSSLTSLGSYAFYKCSKLTSITLPEQVVELKDFTFADCYSLETVILLGPVTAIGEGAFMQCKALTSVSTSQEDAIPGASFPDTLQTLGVDVFKGCPKLTEVLLVSQQAVNSFKDAFDFSIIEKITLEDNVGIAEIGANAFSECSLLTTINIPSSVISIGVGALSGCSSLTEITITDSVTSIGTEAFKDCEKLSILHIGAGVTEVGENIFSGCSNIRSLAVNSQIILNEIKTILPELSNLETVALGGTVNSIPGFESASDTQGKGCFEDCVNLQIVELSNEITMIGKRAFFGCENLSLLDFPEKLATIEESAFEGCLSLTAVRLQDKNSLITIADAAFKECINLAEVTLPASITTVGGQAFASCPRLAKVIFPSSLSNLGAKVVDGCEAVIIYCESEAAGTGWSPEWNNSNRPVIWNCLRNDKDEGGFAYTVFDGVYYAVKDNLARVIKQPSTIVTATIPSVICYKKLVYNVDTIDEAAFSGCTELKSVNLTENTNITALPNGCFKQCRNLTTVTLNENLKTIGSGAFYECTSLAEIAIPENVSTIGEEAFYSCTNLTKVELPDSLSSIPRKAFYGCSRLSELSLPSQLTTISTEAFYGCTSLTSLHILDPEKITIESQAFEGCTSLTVYASCDSWPNGWATDCFGDSPIVYRHVNQHVNGGMIENNDIAEDGYIYTVVDSVRYALKDCKAIVVKQPSCLISANIPKKIKYTPTFIPDTGLLNTSGKEFYYAVTEVKEQAFVGCYDLTTVKLPDSVTSIGREAFFGCGSLRTVTLSAELTSILAGLFSGCVGLEEIIVPDKVKTIESEAFYGCSSLTKIILPNGLETIEEYSFQDCSSLLAVIIPQGVLSLRSNAFEGCGKLKSVTLLPKQPPEIKGETKNLFATIVPTLYCHSETLPAYSCNEYWVDYKKQLVADDLLIYFALAAVSQRKYFAKNSAIQGVDAEINLLERTIEDKRLLIATAEDINNIFANIIE